MLDYDYIFKRYHKEYRKNQTIWRRSHDAYAGGENYIKQALIRHVSEIDLEFAERLKRAYYFNYPRKISRLITQYILSVDPQRENCNIEIAEDFSRNGLRVNEVMRQFSTLLNIYGRATLLVEMPAFEGEVDYERRFKERLRPSVRAISPLQTVDYAYAKDGLLDWILIEEDDFLENGPFLPPQSVKRRKLFTRDEFFIFENNNSAGVNLISQGRYNLGIVPAVIASDADGYGLDSGHYFEDVIRISDAILNNESEAQMNTIKQMFGLLVISDSFARNARPLKKEDNNTSQKFSHVIARSAAIWESPEEKGVSRYISPSGADTRCIREENLLLKKELFDIVGMSLQQEGRLNQSADSKAWDHHNMRQFLSTRVDILEQSESFCWKIINAYDNSIKIPSIIYNREFSIIDLQSAIQSILNLGTLSNSPEFHRELERTGLFLLEKLKKIDPKTRQKITNEITRGE